MAFVELVIQGLLIMEMIVSAIMDFMEIEIHADHVTLVAENAQVLKLTSALPAQIFL